MLPDQLSMNLGRPPDNAESISPFGSRAVENEVHLILRA